MRSLIPLLCALFMLSATAQTDEAMAKKEAKVRAQLAKGRPYKAISLCTGALGIEERPVFRILRADARNRIGEFGEAEHDARQGLAARPGDREGLLQLAIAEHGLGSTDSAAAHFRQVVQMDPPSSVSVRIRLAETYRARKELDLALAQLDTAEAALKPTDGAPLPLLRIKGECLAERGDTASARQAFAAALLAQPDDPIILNSRAWFLHAAYGDHARAIADYDRAIKQNPNYSYAFNNRGWSKFKLGDPIGALKDINLAKKKKPFNPFIYRNLGIIALSRGDRSEACSQFRRALELNFTPVHGGEVARLAQENCGGEKPLQSPIVPLNAPPEVKPVVPPARTNAPE